MRAVLFAPLAVDDLRQIWEYIAADNIDAADRLAEAVRVDAGLLAQFPGIGHTRRDVDDA